MCEVDDPEDRFDIDEYSDFVNPTKPIVFMSVSEIIDTHAVSLEKTKVLSSLAEKQWRYLLRPF